MRTASVVNIEGVIHPAPVPPQKSCFDRRNLRENVAVVVVVQRIVIIVRFDKCRRAYAFPAGGLPIPQRFCTRSGNLVDDKLKVHWLYHGQYFDVRHHDVVGCAVSRGPATPFRDSRS
ncbi:MAG: hypothetical protein KDA96_10025 [Planctomycetaceae bacterium]|nr:hypothetical protein [Planctomycetaceae bacterium]